MANGPLRVGKTLILPPAFALLLAILLTVLRQPAALGAPAAQSPEEGRALFQEKCAACHTIGQGDLVGPDLEGVTGQRDRTWLERWIANPTQMLEQGDPIATELYQQYGNVTMPDLGLTEAQVTSLTAYLEAASSRGEPAQQAQPLPEGDPLMGKNLFTGASRFQRGGPSCRACHSVSGIGALGGGAMGPDLTGIYARLGDAMITWPETVLPMRAIYSEKLLTDQEKAHLLAFFRSGPVGQRPTQAVWQLTGLAVGGVALLLSLTHLVWRRRLGEVRRPMVAGQRGRSS